VDYSETLAFTKLHIIVLENTTHNFIGSPYLKLTTLFRMTVEVVRDVSKPNNTRQKST
jgi:hypothetical protein